MIKPCSWKATYVVGDASNAFSSVMLVNDTFSLSWTRASAVDFEYIWVSQTEG